MFSIAIPRNPGYTIRMNRKQVYRRRLRLRSMLGQLMDTMTSNKAAGIEADHRTATMAARVIRGLMAFCTEAGLTLSEVAECKVDFEQFKRIRFERIRQSRKRNDRARRARKRQRSA